MASVKQVLSTLADYLSNIETATSIISMSPFIHGKPVVNLHLDRALIPDTDTDSIVALMEYEIKMETWLNELTVHSAYCVNDSSFSFVGSQPLGTGFVVGLVFPEKVSTSRILGGEVTEEGEVELFYRSTLGSCRETSVKRLVHGSIPMLESVSVLEKIFDNQTDFRL